MLFKKKVKPEDIDLSTLDKESAYRTFTGWQNTVITIILVCFTTFQLFSSITGRVPQQQVRYIHLGFAIALAFWLYPASVKFSRTKLNIFDLLFGVAFVGVISYCVLNYTELLKRAGRFSDMDMYVGILAIILLIEACRRVVGVPIVVIACIFILYARFGAYMPGFLRHRGYTMKRIITHLFYTTEGIIGTPIGACSTFIFLFIMFGAFLEKTGIGQFFIDIANSLAGWAAGGPAKVAVLSSALQGTVSGSSVANTVSTGSFTIPLMKSLGYKPEFAAAVEAAASTGGQIMPPIMGAAAFLISEAVGVPYLDVAKAAIVPALLYFSGIWIMVHFEAKRLGLLGIPREQLPKAGPLMKTRGHLIIPLFTIIILLVIGFTTTRAALLGTLTCIIVPYFSKNTRVPFKDVAMAYPNAARNIISVACACGVAGIIVGVVTLTGLGLKLGESLVSLTGGHLFLTLFFAMITSIVLGMGVPTTANYLITSTIAAPILVKLGVSVFTAHMFCFYFGIVADITPPVALAAYAGSAIAKSDPFKTGVNASKLAIAAFLVPYLFVYNPQMILIGATPLNMIQVIATSLIGMVGIGSGLTGYFLTDARWYERLFLVAGGLGMLKPGTITDVIGFVVLLAIAFLQHTRIKKNAVA
ncbi:MAG TPA: TRAP transporter permease [Clostridia bacterium]|nr:TRAP transporter permease [Clostridia bacterium]